MRALLKIEEAGLFILFSYLYFWEFRGDGMKFLYLFFVPDISFIVWIRNISTMKIKGATAVLIK